MITSFFNKPLSDDLSGMKTKSCKFLSTKQRWWGLISSNGSDWRLEELFHSKTQWEIWEWSVSRKLKGSGLVGLILSRYNRHLYSRIISGKQMHTSKVKTLLIGSQIGPTRFIRKTQTSVPRLAPGRPICNRRNARPIRVGLQTSFKTRKHSFIHNNEFDWK